MNIPDYTPVSLPCCSQEQVCNLYQQLHETDKPDVVAQFEDVLVNVIKDMRKLQHENERLEKSYKRYYVAMLPII